MVVASTASLPIEASNAARKLHNDAFVFDALSAAYVLDEKYTERCLAGGVNGTNVTVAVEECWDQMLRNLDTYLKKIEKSPLLMLCTTRGDLLTAKEKGKLGIVLGYSGRDNVGRPALALGLPGAARRSRPRACIYDRKSFWRWMRGAAQRRLDLSRRGTDRQGKRAANND